jgi:hypothetical protein
MCAFAVIAFVGLVYSVLCVMENKRRDAKYGKPQDVAESGLEADRDDKTDAQNSNFRYTY